MAATSALIEGKCGDTKFFIRQVTLSEVRQVHRLTSADGWSATLEEQEMVWHAHENNWFGAFLEDGTLISESNSFLLN